MNSKVGLSIFAPAAFQAGLREANSLFEQTLGIQVKLSYGPAGGHTPNAIVQRLANGEHFDIVLLPLAMLSEQIRASRVRPDFVEVLRSGIGACVPAGDPLPDISSALVLRQTLLKARRIACSTAGSGEYVVGSLLDILGIESEVKSKIWRLATEPVARVVSRREADLGFQQMSELHAETGVTIIGPLPAEVQRFTVVAAGLNATLTDAEPLARQWISHLRSSDAAHLLIASGIDPIRAG